MKILVVTTSYPRHAGDAAGSFVATRVAALRADGAQVTVIAAGDTGDGDVVRVPASSPGGPALFYAGGAPEAFERAPFAAGAAAAAFWGGLCAVLRAHLPGADRVETHWLVPSALAVRACGYRGPHRAHAHSGDVALLERLPLGAALARYLLAAPCQLSFASGELRARLGRLTGRDLSAAEVAPATSPLVDAPVRLADARGFLAGQGVAGPVVLGVGRLVAIKGYDRLVRAIGRMPRAGRPTLVLLGAGPERGRLLALARARGVELLLPGEVPSAEVGAWLASAQVFAHPARRLGNGRSEGLPVAVREAMSAGLPVVASATGGLPELAMGSARFTLLQDGEGTAALAAWSQALATALREDPGASG